jgi:hypothetical protein
MRLYSIILFSQIAAALGLFASLSFELLALFHLWQASNRYEVRHFIDAMPGLLLVAMTSFLNGVLFRHLPNVRISAFDTARPKVTIAILLLIAPLGAVTGKRMRVIQGRSADMTRELVRRLNDPFVEDFTWYPNRRLFGDSVAHERQTGIVAIDRHRSVFCNSRCLIGVAGLAPEWTATH